MIQIAPQMRILVATEPVAFPRKLIASHPTLSRRALPAKVCEAWNWVQPNGQ